MYAHLRTLLRAPGCTDAATALLQLQHYHHPCCNRADKPVWVLQSGLTVIPDEQHNPEQRTLFTVPGDALAV